MYIKKSCKPLIVIHRIGGLEICLIPCLYMSDVIHRIGGLETANNTIQPITRVIHRIGGLENQ